MAKRKIIEIDEIKCTGCGLCIPNCPEGAIQVIDGKACLVSDSFCDGLGACLGHCPEGAITIEEREAQGYDEKKVMQNLARSFSGCPGSKVTDLKNQQGDKTEEKSSIGVNSQLRNWPVQLMLVPPFASFLNHADVLIAADCVAFAYADFQQNLLKDKVLLVGCPKLDDINLYKEKIARILEDNQIKSITYAYMEVPCCFGLLEIIRGAIAASGKDISFSEAVISIKGERLK